MVDMIGVLDLQGGVFEHLDHLSRIGIEGRSVKEPSEIQGLSGLILFPALHDTD